MREFKYEIKQKLMSIGENEHSKLELNLISFNDRDPKYDLRRWNRESNTMLKGVSMTRDELKALYEILKQEFC